MQAPVKIYIDYISQPARAVLAFCICNGIPHEIKETRLSNRENKTEEFKKISPTTKVPAMEHNGFTAFESHAILRYLATLPEAKEEWYPKEIKLRTHVDEYLDWHHTSIRFHSGSIMFYGVFAKNMGLNIKEIPNLAFHRNMLKAGLKFFNDYFLKDNKFINGFEHPTLADLSAYCELISMKIIDYDFEPYPNVKDWFERVGSIDGVKKAHEKYQKVVKMIKQMQSKL